MRPGVLLLAKRWGLKPVLVFGTIAVAVSYQMLAAVRGIGLPLAAYCIVASLGGVLYWSSFHAPFAATGDADHRGHQVGAREALAAVLGIIAPLCGGFSLGTAALLALRGAAAVVAVLNRYYGRTEAAA